MHFCIAPGQRDIISVKFQKAKLLTVKQLLLPHLTSVWQPTLVHSVPKLYARIDINPVLMLFINIMGLFFLRR